MRAYHFLSERYGIAALGNRRLKIATIGGLNDPFELNPFAISDPEIRQAFARTKASLAEEMGMICFSRTWRNPVQWSHYADHHRGVCLGFDVPDQLIFPVAYVAKRPCIDPALLGKTPDGAQEMISRILTTKFSHWRYEQEVRRFVSLDRNRLENGLYFQPFSDSLRLREVIVGHCSNISRSQIADALDLADGVKLVKARLAFRSFRVVTQRRTDLWT